ncbi:MAG: hypothetical protein GY785_25875 [Gammaproteobacteria bacterium]|nr:hypothetical protein [Gammaproteobacteria bacterium]
MSAGRARGSGRRRGGRTRERVQADAPAFIKRQIPFYEFLGEEGIVKLEEQADWVIQEIGLEFRHDPKALETEKSRAEDSVAMARILHGEDFMEENCVIMGNVNTNSPLLVDRVVTEAAQVYCGANQGLIVAPFILGGAMGPVTTAASIAQAFAEAMMVGAFTQLARRAYERWNQLLKECPAPMLAEDKDEALCAYIDKRKSEIPDAWY